MPVYMTNAELDAVLTGKLSTDGTDKLILWDSDHTITMPCTGAKSQTIELTNDNDAITMAVTEVV